MAIPDTQIQVFKGIPWDKSYTDVRLFDSAAARDTYFNNKAVRTFTNFVYQRHDSGTPGKAAHSVKVDCHADQIRTCNYIRFRNQSVPSVTPRWFYGFITGINYLNQNACEIVYELDDFQNWFYNLELLPCPISRRHSTGQEEMFANYSLSQGTFNNRTTSNLYLSNEKVQVLNYVNNYLNGQNIFINGDSRILILTTHWKTTQHPNIDLAFADNKVDPSKYDSFLRFGTYSNLTAWEFDPKATYLTSARRFIDMITEEFGIDQIGNVIVNMYMVPASVAETYSMNGLTGALFNDNLPCQEGRISFLENNFVYASGSPSISHEIRNAKLKFGPFRKLLFTSGSGEIEEVMPQDTDRRFTLYCRNIPDVHYVLVPHLDAWSLSGADGFYKPTEIRKMITFQTNNTLPFTGNQYLSAKSAPLRDLKNGQFLNNIASAASNIVTGNIAGVATDVFGGILGYEANILAGQRAADSLISGFGNPDTCWMAACNNEIVGQRYLGFTVLDMVPSQADADKIDDFFDYYGYNMDGKVEKPLLHGRVNWNYCQTVNCLTKGDIPEDARRSIHAIFNKGARFWHVDPSGSYTTNDTTEHPDPPSPPTPPTPVGTPFYDPCNYVAPPSESFGEENTSRPGMFTIHSAVDVTGGNGDIYPVNEGRVRWLASEAESGGYGNVTYVEHEVRYESKTYYYYTQYAHMQSNEQLQYADAIPNVPGKSDATRLGKMGSTGESTGVHLHCAMFTTKNGAKLYNTNPVRGYISKNNMVKGENWLKDTSIPDGLTYYDWTKFSSTDDLINAMISAGVISE